MQKANIRELFEQLFSVHKFDVIIEFGTASGQLTSILSELNPSSTTLVITIDKEKFDTEYNKKIRADPNILCLYGDIFSEKMIEKVSNSIIFGDKVLLLCDNGNKIEEFRIYSKFLKVGDFIMAHDYAYDIEQFNKNQYWSHLEITHADIENELNMYNLTPYNIEYSEQFAWCCYEKTW